jgi:hypothetical protein
MGLRLPGTLLQEGLLSLELGDESEGGAYPGPRGGLGKQPTVGASQLQAVISHSSQQLIALVANNRQKSLNGGKARHRRACAGPVGGGEGGARARALDALPWVGGCGVST